MLFYGFVELIQYGGLGNIDVLDRRDSSQGGE